MHISYVSHMSNNGLIMQIYNITKAIIAKL